MAYREPGVYNQIVTTRPNVGIAPNLIPLIIGEGPKYLDFSGIQITRSSSGLTDELPSSLVTAITRVYTISGGVETTIAATDNYTLTNPNIITWGAQAAGKPANGATYYVDYEARPEDTQYELTYVTSFAELDQAYVGMFMKTASLGLSTALNPVYLGAYLALESGSTGVYVIQIEPANKTTYAVVQSTDMATSLERAVAAEDAYFIVPMTQDSDAVGDVITHCTDMSAELERKERVAFVGVDIDNPAASSGIFSTAEIAAAAAALTFENSRVRVPFVTEVTKVLSDGIEHTLTAEYVCAALAGLAASIPVSRALTRQNLYNFKSLKYCIGMTRAGKNSLAEVCYIILEQAGGPGSAISIRHGLTTDMTSVATREHSIITAMDYVAKFVRNSLRGYIGVNNVDAFLVTKVNGSLTSVRNSLTDDNIIRNMTILRVAQDTDNPDTLLVSISILPLYPCNYIDIDIIVE